MLCTLLISGSVFPHSLPVGESERLPVERRPRRVRKRSLTFLACSSSSRFFCRSSSESCSSGSWSFTRSITLPVLSKRDKNTHASTQKKKYSKQEVGKVCECFLRTRRIHRWMSANKSAEEDWPNQRCCYFISLSPQKRATAKAAKAAKAFEACGRTRRQIHVTGHRWPNLVEMFFIFRKTDFSTTWHQSCFRSAVWLRRHFERSVVGACVYTGFTHRLLWWVLQTSFWASDFWDCAAWVRKQ